MATKKTNPLYEAEKTVVLPVIGFLIFFFYFFAGLSFASPAYGATYYVDPTCTYSGDGTGPDCATGNGQSGAFKKWSSVTWAAGNTYLQKGGTTVTSATEGLAHEKMNMIAVTASGIVGNPIVIGSYGEGKATINGGFTIPYGSPWIDNGDGTYKWASAWGATFIWEDDIPLKQASDKSCSDGNWWFSYSGTDSGVIYYRPTSGIPADHIVESYQFYGIHTNNNTNIVVDGINITKTYYGIGNNYSSLGDISNITIKNSGFSNVMHAVLFQTKVNASTISITDNTFDSCARSIELATNVALGTIDAVEIARNTLARVTNVNGTDAYTWNNALAHSSPSTKMATDEEGIGCQDITNANIHHNYITGYGRAIYPYANGTKTTANVNIFNNYIKTQKIGVLLLPSTLVAAYHDIRVYNNIFDTTGAAEGVGSTFDAAIVAKYKNPTSQWNYIYNNTIVNSPHSLNVIPITGSTSMYLSFKNNISYNPTYQHIFEYVAQPAQIVYDYNLYYPDTANRFRYFTATYHDVDFAGWKSADENHDAHGPMPADPLFRFSSDFSLQDISPAINAGVNVGLTVDYAGNPVPSGPLPDIGAYEFQEP